MDKPIQEINWEGIYGDPSIRSGHFGVKYRGINCVKCPMDYVLYQMIINEVMPDLIIEIGTFNGGSALYLSDLLKCSGIKGEIHTIDIYDGVNDPLILENESIKRFNGGFLKYDITLAEKFKKIMVIDDGSHKYNDCLDAFKKFNELVSIGSYYIIEDSIINKYGYNSQFNGGHWFAIMEILKNNTNYKIERRWCDFFGKNATFNIDGYLIKTK